MASSRTITRSAWSLAPTLNYAQMIKVYMNPTPEEQRRYSPARVAGVIGKDVYGEPDFDLICTSHIERLHGSLRQWCKRLTRLT